MECLGMSSESLMLAIQLLLEDVELCEKSKKGKEREDEMLDCDVALQSCLSIAEAVELDAALIAELMAQEEQAARDRQFALRLSINSSATPTPASSQTNSAEPPINDLDDSLIERFRLMNRFVPDYAESSSSASSRVQPETGECIACTDRFSSSALFRSPCSHEYCHECLVGLVQASLRDESLFPPRCCRQDIPIEASSWFSPTLVGALQARKLELDTPNRIYCSEPSCSAFVPPEFIKDEVARCPKCSQTTCAQCKGPSHEGICPNDDASKEVLTLANKKGWQRCYACHRVVELNRGCNHITCKCKAEFCYACGKQWRTCTCPRWHEQHLIDRPNVPANENVGVDLGLRQLHIEQQQRRRQLAENGECRHESWERQPGPCRCHECSMMLRNYIYQCLDCFMAVCGQCRYNRL